MKLIRALFKVIAVVYVPILLILSFIPETTEGGNAYFLYLLLFFLFSVPFYCVFLEIGTTITLILEKRVQTVPERVIYAIRLLLCAGIMLTIINLSELLRFAIIMAFAWGVFKLVGAVMFRKKQTENGVIDKKRFIITLVAVIAAIMIIVFAFVLYLDIANLKVLH